MKRLMIGAAAVLAGAALSVPAAATQISCANTSDGRYVTVTYDGTGVTCGPSGSTPPSEGQVLAAAGYNFLEKDGDGGAADNNNGGYLNISGLTQNGGSFSITGVGTDALLVFKFGSNLSPDWISFNLFGITSGTWTVTPARRGAGLSHASLYGTGTSVPEPGSLALLGLGLFGLGMARRRKA